MAHDEILRRHGGRPGLLHEECIEGRFGTAYTASLYTAGDIASDIEIALGFAGYLLFYLARDHCFVEGNKRTAWTAATLILASQGLTIEASDDEGEELMDRVAAENTTVTGKDVVAWIEPRLVAIPMEEG